MNAKKDRSKDTSVQSPAQQASQQRRPQAGGKASTGSQQPEQSPEDALPGREYQGSGVANKAGRFGSSKRPEDLSGGTGTKKR